MPSSARPPKTTSLSLLIIIKNLCSSFGANLLVLFLAVSINGCGGKIITQIVYEGNQFYERQQYDKALALYKEAYKQDPNNLAVKNNLGVTYSVLNDQAQAIKYLNLAIAQDKKDYIAHYVLADIYLKQNELNQALDEALTAKSLNTKETQIYETLGKIYMALKQYDNAISTFTDLINLDQYEPHNFVELANAYLANKDIDKAKANLNKALELDSDNKEAKDLLIKIAKDEKPKMSD